MNYLMMKSGLTPGKYSGTLMQWNRGWSADSGGTTQICFGTEAYTDLTQVGACAPTAAWFAVNTPSIPAPDLTTFGNIYIGGKDTNFDPTASPYGIQYYELMDLTTGNVVIMASQSISYSGVASPAGWPAVGSANLAIRKHWFAHSYRADWGGIPNFMVDGVGGATVRFTDTQDSSPWAVVYGGKTGGLWQNLNLANYLPDAGRIVRFRTEVRYNGGSAGSAYLRPYQALATGQGVGSVSPGSPYGGKTIEIQTDSGRNINILTTGDACLYLYLDAYTLTDPC